MRELITFHVGECGAAIASQFWEQVSAEHCVDPAGNFSCNNPLAIEKIRVLYTEAKRKYSARAIFVDSDPDVHNVRRTLYGRIFNSELFINGKESTGTNFAKGYFTEGVELCDPALDAARKLAEACDCIQGFQIMHSLGGGIGSGFTSLLVKHLADEYPKIIKSTYSIFPSPKVSEIVVEPYNCILSIPHLSNNTELIFAIDNEALHSICIKQLRFPTSTYQDMNHIVAQTISNITSTMRYPSEMNCDLQTMYTNMVPQPDLPYLLTALAPFPSSQGTTRIDTSVQELIFQIFTGQAYLAECDVNKGKYMTAEIIFRGANVPKIIDDTMGNVRTKFGGRSLDWIPNSLKHTVIRDPPKGMKTSASAIANTTAMKFIFERMMKQFEVMFQRRTNLNWYTGEGMEEAEFLAAGKDAKEIIRVYNSFYKPRSASPTASTWG